MKMKVVTLIATGLLTAAIWGYSQMMGPQDTYGCPDEQFGGAEHAKTSNDGLV